MTLNQFVDKYLNKKVDFDGAYGGQCVDLYRMYNKEVLNISQPKGVTGAADFWSNYDTDPILKTNFTKISNTPEFIPIAGDVMIWTRKYGPYGHIAIVTQADINQFTCFSQNDPTGQPCILKTYKYVNVYGVLRPKVQITSETMSENTDLNKVLTYYKVKTSDELIKMVDEQLGFLKSERESNQKLNSQIEGLKTTISEANKKFSTFVQNIVDKLNPIHPIMGMVDETVCLGLIDEVVAQVSQLGTQLSKQEKIAQEKERELTDKNNELLRQIEQLQKEKNAIQSQVDKLQKGLDQVKQDQQTQKQEQADFESFKSLVNSIKKFVEGLYAKGKRK